MIAGIIGYTGYTGIELLKLLNRHYYIDRINLFSNSVNSKSEFPRDFLLTNKKKISFLFKISTSNKRMWRFVFLYSWRILPREC